LQEKGLMKESSYKDSFLGVKLVSLNRREALCFVSTFDKPFLLSKVAGILTIHDCHILEAEINIRDGVVTDLYKIRIPQKYEPALLENMLFESFQKVLKGDTNIEKEIFLWEKKREVIRDHIVPKFKSIKDDQSILTVNTSNKKGLLHKISWALSLAGMNIEKAIISATEDMKAEDVFWIKRRYGEKITPEYQKKVLNLLNIIVNEGKDPI
jgi:UTP:GlnB (protein PII) uridylyltransferase